MTRTEAINVLSALWRYIGVDEKTALEMAIEALKQQSAIEDIKAEIKETYHDRPSSYNHPQRRELYQKVLEIIDKHISRKENG